MNPTQQRHAHYSECERDEVCVWRRSQLVRLGFPELLADRAARDSRYDLHQLLDLVENGCPPELAMRILAPLELDVAA